MSIQDGIASLLISGTTKSGFYVYAHEWEKDALAKLEELGIAGPIEPSNHNHFDLMALFCAPGLNPAPLVKAAEIKLRGSGIHV